MRRCWPRRDAVTPATRTARRTPRRSPPWRSAAGGWPLDVAGQVRRAGDVMNSILAVLRGDHRSRAMRVVINPPVYPPFRQVIAGYGRRIVEAAARRRPDGSTWRRSRRPSPVRTGPGAYLLCSPHNPTGAVHTGRELTAAMAAVLRASTVPADRRRDPRLPGGSGGRVRPAARRRRRRGCDQRDVAPARRGTWRPSRPA